MKLTKEDVEKYGTEEEMEFLLELKDINSTSKEFKEGDGVYFVDASGKKRKGWIHKLRPRKAIVKTLDAEAVQNVSDARYGTHSIAYHQMKKK